MNTPGDMADHKDYLSEKFRKFLVKVDIIYHMAAALLLLTACSFMLWYALANIFTPSRDSIIHMVNDVLLSLIILELLWTVIRFLKRQKFVLGPFLAIGIIAAVRRILLVEAQTSFMEHAPVDKLYELGLSAAVVLVLMIAYFLAQKADKDEQR
ncbi:MAG TPA: phosphate-starvation-inducible PsiE family protein [Dissulfurispiraceae bacterium]|nr:phosphate-starvation-inducible PsiE family protein [Dissulfurispiraceae bacterium]